MLRETAFIGSLFNYWLPVGFSDKIPRSSGADVLQPKPTSGSTPAWESFLSKPLQLSVDSADHTWDEPAERLCCILMGLHLFRSREATVCMQSCWDTGCLLLVLKTLCCFCDSVPIYFLQRITCTFDNDTQVYFSRACHVYEHFILWWFEWIGICCMESNIHYYLIKIPASAKAHVFPQLYQADSVLIWW